MNSPFTLVDQYTTWIYAAWWVHMQPPSSFWSITHEHEVFERFLLVVTRIVTSDKAMSSIILDSMVGSVVHAFKKILNGTNNYDCPNKQNL